jgi:DNA ligase (NAD+)
MRELIDELNAACDAYYNSDTPIMSDQEFDLKLEKLSQLEKESGIIYSDSPTQKVGYPVLNGLNKISITPKPMLSLDKCHTAQEIESFAQDKPVFASLKCDGVSVRLKYQDGILTSANTRGNGEIGTDITEHVRHFKNVPLTIGISDTYIIDGEAVIKYSDFDTINANNEFKNPRNTVAGTLNLLDMDTVRKRRISFIAWEVITPTHEYKSENLSEATKYFEVTPFCCPHLKHESVEDVNETITKWGKDNGIPSDGVVWKFDDIKYAESLGATSHHFRDGIAWKPEVKVAESRLRYINWQMGRTGVLTPVAVFEPVELDGSIVERASLHNYSIMRKVLGSCAYCGEGLKIIKANMIIPQIIEGFPQYNYGEVISRGGVSAHDVLEQCPVCRGEVTLRQSADGVLNYWCDNPGCEGKLINKIRPLLWEKRSGY